VIWFMEDKTIGMKSILYIFSLLLFLSCGNESVEAGDKNSSTSSADKEQTEQEDPRKKVVEEKVEGTNIYTDLTEEEKDNAKAEVIKEISPHKEKTCEEILIDYKALVEAVKLSPTDENYKNVQYYRNDPLFDKCKKQDEGFKKQVYELNKTIDD